METWRNAEGSFGSPMIRKYDSTCNQSKCYLLEVQKQDKRKQYLLRNYLQHEQDEENIILSRICNKNISNFHLAMTEKQGSNHTI